MRKPPFGAGLLLVGTFLAGACSSADRVEPPSVGRDGEFEPAAPVGKADSVYGACEVREAVAWLNDPARRVDDLTAVGVDPEAANGILLHRNGPDAQPDTEDDNPFDDAQELDDVSWVGPNAFAKLTAAMRSRCEAAPTAEVIFSPQPYDQSHLSRMVALIDQAQHSLDIAMYSFSDTPILDAINRAVERGVSIRFVFDTASEDRKKPQGTWSAKLEDRGVDVRYVNKIMHHKFLIVDGPRSSRDAAYSAILATGSANWSGSAGTRYDENTVVLRGSGELVLLFQREFDYLWNNSRDFAWNNGLEFLSSRPITQWLIADDPGVEAVFTSANFKVSSTSNGPTFSVISGRNTVADRLVTLIQGATQSILIASGHLRSRPVFEALLAKHASDPNLDIRIYLDGQEYIGEGYHRSQQEELDQCLADADGSASKEQACLDKGFYFSYAAHEAGIPVRFKYSCYRWDYRYAVQMHHKYMLVDGSVVASGSYNLSDNAEHNTMENMVVYGADRIAGLADAFRGNFEQIWVTGEAEGRYESLVEHIETPTEPVPLVFDPMALTWDQVTELRQLIRANCAAVDSDAYRAEPHKHLSCPR